MSRSDLTHCRRWFARDFDYTTPLSFHTSTIQILYATMSNRSSAPGIPAWQRAQQPMSSEPNTTAEPQSQDADTKDNDAPGAEDSTIEDSSQDVADRQSGGDEIAPAAEDRTRQIEMVKKFLEDPGVKDEPVEKKREFLESKGITKEMIDQELGTNPSSSTLDTSDFTNFREITPTPRAPQPPPRATGPPIITYPEFLEDARKPPPLITPSRVLTATYLASGIAALAYGASTFLIKPMAASLTDARHDFATHGQSKIDEFNERISKLVSKIPEPKFSSDGTDADDSESVASDPSELFHRDIGTQTSPAITPPLSSANANSETKTTVDKQNDRLSVIKSHLDEMLAGVQAGEQPAKERMDETNKLRHQLDNMMFRVQTANAWGGFGMDQKAASETEDGIEELKKEIRGVKGVLLSAKRFAPVASAPAPGRFGT